MMRLFVRLLAVLALLVPVAGAVTATPSGARADDGSEEIADPADERFRPYLHFTPRANWMNDPNGMVFHEGTWHLFFQHNPYGTRWGNMSWGHATSSDLLHWEEQPVAISQTYDNQGRAIEDIFSGSVVSDTANTSGLGSADNPPLVALYTSAYTQDHPTRAGRQAQSVAYSLDDGQTWTKYDGNPVLDRGSANFRDPKVFRYDGPAGSYWVMVAVEAVDHKVVLYKSDNLIDWTYLSEFGDANATGGIWECPDLFPLAVDGDPGNTKWVLVVNLNPGSVAGGSGGQYFVGEFDGTAFHSESKVTTPVTVDGTTLAGFDGGTFEGWAVSNEPGNDQSGPWGHAPATGTLPGQNPVTGQHGAGFVNGFHGGDWPVGTIESPEFTIEDDFINFLVGGGRHPHVAGSQLGNEPPAGRLLFDGFEHDGSVVDRGWTLNGDFELARNPSTQGGDYYIGAKRINTFEGGPHGDGNLGTLTSPEFTLDDEWLSFLLGGGRRTDGSLQVELVVDGDVVRTATGPEAGQLNWKAWDVSPYVGRPARLRVVDQATGGWGHLTLDHVVLGPEPARVRSDETAVNLVVDGEVVRSATGADSEALDVTSWDVSDLVGQRATVQVVDNNRFGWGHVLADQFTTSDTPARRGLARYDWLDWGRDYYAGVSFSGVPDGRRVMIAWMNNWDYANEIPTGSWRSAMALPREVRLVSTEHGPRLAQQVVEEIDELRDEADTWTADPGGLSGSTVLPVTGDLVQIDAEIDMGSASRAGLSVLGGAEHETRIGYDVRRRELFVDRTDSGDTSFHPLFSSRDAAPVALDSGTLRIRVYVDRSSVEVFTADGRTTITDQVFPEEGADDIGAWAEGGTAVIESLTVTPLDPAMWAEPESPRLTQEVPPSVSGQRVVGSELTVADGIWHPEPDARTFQWLRDGVPIDGATSSSYRVTAADLRTSVSVRVTAAKAGYTDDVATSAPVRISSRATPTVTATDVDVTYGNSASMPVTVSASGVIPTGRATLRVGDVVLGTGTLADGAATVSIAARRVPAGTHEATISYGGDGSVRPGTTMATLTVRKAMPTVSGARTVVEYGREALIRVRVRARGVVASGEVVVEAGGVELGSAELDAGSATVRLPATALPPGTHDVTISYAGSDLVASGDASAVLRVLKAPSTVTAADAEISWRRGGSMTVGVSAFGVLPTGRVVLRVGDVVVGTGVLVDGAVAARIFARRVPVGTHDVAVSYSGDTFVKHGVGYAELTVAPWSRRGAGGDEVPELVFW